MRPRIDGSAPLAYIKIMQNGMGVFSVGRSGQQQLFRARRRDIKT